MQNDLVEAVRDGMISTLILTRKHLTVDDVDDLARAAIQTTAEHFAGVAEGVKYAKHIVEQRSREGDTGAECFNEGCDEAIAAIRASVEPTP